ncbi:MAG: hypothetical protein AAF975_03020 [Spirochaetota bacterium]
MSLLRLGLAPRFSLPLAVAIALGALLEDIFRFFRIKVAPPLTRYRVAQLRWDNTFSPQKAREELGFSAEVPFAEGVRRLCLAYQEQQGTVLVQKASNPFAKSK